MHLCSTGGFLGREYESVGISVELQLFSMSMLQEVQKTFISTLIPQGRGI
jgi:hypothetical protein